MSRYRICRTFTVESGHMLSKHPARCRFPHGHTRKIEVVISSDQLDSNEMVLDFKALKLALKPEFDLLDHAMAMNSEDPFLPEMQSRFPDGVVVYENQDPTTEVMAYKFYQSVAKILATGWQGLDINVTKYSIPGGRATVDRVRVWETPNAWAEFGN